MEPRLKDPHNIPSIIGCVLGLELAATTSERFSGGRTQPYLKWEKRRHPKHIARASPGIIQNCPR